MCIRIGEFDKPFKTPPKLKVLLSFTRKKSALHARARYARMEPPIQCHPRGPRGPIPHLGSALEGSPEKALTSHPIII